jgi:hypothetical protein
MIDNVNYRIENLELRLPKIPNNSESSSALREIVKWQKNDSSPNKECCYTIAIFSYDRDEGYPEVRFVGNRPMELNTDEWEAFKILLEEGYKYKIDYENYKYIKI